MLSSSKITSKIMALALAVFGVLSIAATSTFAKSITKSFEIGAGTAHSHSHYRTFAVPCGLDVTASVKYLRKGDAGASNDVPIIIELRQPGETDSEDGPVAEQEQVTATRNQQTAALGGQESNRGCSLPWRVRVKYANAGEAPFAVYGDITVTFNDASKSISVEGGLISLLKGNNVTKKIGNSSGFGHGVIEITGTWLHSLGNLVPGPNPVKLKFQLIDPDGNTVETESGFSSNDINPAATPKFKLTYRVTSCKSGQWKIKITNNTNDDTMNIDPKVKFKPDCP